MKPALIQCFQSKRPARTVVSLPREEPTPAENTRGLHPRILWVRPPVHFPEASGLRLRKGSRTVGFPRLLPLLLPALMPKVHRSHLPPPLWQKHRPTIWLARGVFH